MLMCVCVVIRCVYVNVGIVCECVFVSLSLLADLIICISPAVLEVKFCFV